MLHVKLSDYQAVRLAGLVPIICTYIEIHNNRSEDSYLKSHSTFTNSPLHSCLMGTGIILTCL